MIVNSPRSAASRVAVIATVFSAFVFSATPLIAQSASDSAAVASASALNVNSAGVAIHGFDPVAYYTTGEPTKGAASFAATYRGATWHFATAANRGAFLAKPESYAPQYGGYCAMGVAGGAKFDIDPTAWRIENGRLYLNKDPRTQRSWLRDVPGNIVKADEKWPAVKPKPRR